MTAEKKFLLAPKSHGLYLNDALVRGAGTVDLGEEGDADSELVENGILEVAILESVLWHISPSV